MSHFWRFAARMLRRRRTLVLALLMAFVSALSMGGGLLAIVPMLRAILGEEGATLPEMASDVSDRLPITLPAEWIAGLPSDRIDAVIWIILGLIALTIFGATANFLHSYLSFTVSTRTVADIRRDAFRHVLHLPLRSLVGRTSDTLSRIISDTNMLLNGFNSLTSKTVAQVTKALAALGAALIVEWRLTLVGLLVAPLLYIIVRKLGKRVRRAARGAMQAQAKLLGAATEALQGLRVVKVHSSERYELGRFSRHNRRVVREQLRARTARALAAPLNETVMIIVVGGLAILASKAIIDGRIGMSEFVVALGALGIAGAALKPLTNVVQDIQASSAAAVRLAELMETDPEPLHIFNKGKARHPRLERHQRSITFDNVSFTYPDADTPAVDGVSLEIPHGETVAFVGPNGSGKTTLLSLVPRLFDPDAGRVLVDGADIASVDLKSLRRQIGVVTQEVILFHATIAENIAYGASGVSRAQIEEAARNAGADEFIRAKPGAYDGVVGEQGLSLSGGQRQRIAIARALLRNPAILILDEATSMIDAESERRIGEALARFRTGRTCLFVAHRLSTVLQADRIVVLDVGRIVDVGRHEALLERCEIYSLIARTQLVPTGAGA
ncbi:MAG: ABC transporter ATP-binding protein [Phycisphaeraceae bacterium]|nr:MAG: ABC transporter ATP-binding protein [Phycisphaeraceae bacterium]